MLCVEYLIIKLGFKSDAIVLIRSEIIHIMKILILTWGTRTETAIALSNTRKRS